MGMRSGFSLIELLVSVGMIALLISLLLPVLGNARDSAQAVDCISQQKQLRTAWEGVLIDRKGRYPITESAIADERWDVLMLRSMGFDLSQTRPFMACPTAQDVYGDLTLTQGYTSYGANVRWGDGGAAGDNEDRNIDTLLVPSTYPVWSDTAAFNVIQPPIIYDVIGKTPTEHWRMGFIHPQDVCNVTWADGHVSGVNPASLGFEVDSIGTPVFFLNRPVSRRLAMR